MSESTLRSIINCPMTSKELRTLATEKLITMMHEYAESLEG